MRALDDELALYGPGDPGELPDADNPLAQLGARLLSDVSIAPAPPTLLGRLDPEGATVLFGEGGIGKGIMAAWWIVGLVGLDHRVLLVDYEATRANGRDV